MKFNIGFDSSKIKLSDMDKQLIAKEGFKFIFESVLNIALMTKYEKGVAGSKLRTLDRIYKKLDASTDNTVELEMGEIDFLRESFADVNVMPQQVRIFCLYQEEIERCYKEGQ